MFAKDFQQHEIHTTKLQYISSTAPVVDVAWLCPVTPIVVT